MTTRNPRGEQQEPKEERPKEEGEKPKGPTPEQRAHVQKAEAFEIDAQRCAEYSATGAAIMLTEAAKHWKEAGDSNRESIALKSADLLKKRGEGK